MVGVAGDDAVVVVVVVNVIGPAQAGHMDQAAKRPGSFIVGL